jgi:hypothetical protein
MPTNVTVKRIKGKRAKISFSIAFNQDDPKAQDIYTALGVMLKHILTPDEATEFLRRLDDEKMKLAAVPEGGA